MKKEVDRIVFFPETAPHRLDTGGVGGVEIKHIHPEHTTEDERREQLTSMHRTCAALISAQRQKEALRRGKGA